MNRERPTEDAIMSRLPTAISIRRYRPADAAATRTVFEEAIRGTAARHYDPDQIEAWAPSGPADLVTWNTRRAKAWTVVAVRDSEVVGFADLVDGDLLDMLFVHPDAGGQGVARALLSAVLDQARSVGATRVVTHSSKAARAAFERFGFVVDRENSRNHIRGVSVPNYDMHIVL